MKKILFGFGLSILGLNSLAVNAARADTVTLKIVFEDSVWGGAVGAVAGLAVWGLQETETSEIPRLILRGAALGVFVGMGFGFYDAQDQKAYFGSQPVPAKGLLHYDAQAQSLTLTPTKFIPSILGDATTPRYVSTVFSGSF